jgi:hypothetical protein
MAHLPTTGRANKRKTLRRTRRMDWGSRTPKGTSRPYTAILTLSLAPISTARCSTSCSEVLGTSPRVTSSRICAERWRRPHLPQRRHYTTGGWRRQSASTPLTTPRAWQGSSSAPAACLPGHHQYQVIPRLYRLWCNAKSDQLGNF